MMIKKLKLLLVGGPRGQNHGFRGILRFKPLFCQSALTTPTKLAENVYLGFLQHLIKFNAEILTGKFYS